MMNGIYKWLSVAALPLLLSCGGGSVTGAEKKAAGKADAPTQVQTVHRPDFSADSAMAYLQAQCGFGARVPGTEAHRRCAGYLQQQLERLCDEVQAQRFTAVNYEGKLLEGVNLIGRLHPEAQRRVALFAHWDSRPFCDNDKKEYWLQPVMGANDGASGVAVLLEVARQLRLSADSLGVDIVFLDLEDYGTPSFSTEGREDTWCLGAQHLARHPYYKVRPQWGILLDMVGGAEPHFGFDRVSLHFAEQYLSQVWQTAVGLGYAEAFRPIETGAIVDDHYYINLLAGIPTIDIIDYSAERGFPDTWHTVRDTPENIHPATLRMVGEVVLQTLRNQTKQ